MKLSVLEVTHVYSCILKLCGHIFELQSSFSPKHIFLPITSIDNVTQKKQLSKSVSLPIPKGASIGETFLIHYFSFPLFEISGNRSFIRLFLQTFNIRKRKRMLHWREQLFQGLITKSVSSSLKHRKPTLSHLISQQLLLNIVNHNSSGT